MAATVAGEKWRSAAVILRSGETATLVEEARRCPWLVSGDEATTVGIATATTTATIIVGGGCGYFTVAAARVC